MKKTLIPAIIGGAVLVAGIVALSVFLVECASLDGESSDEDLTDILHNDEVDSCRKYIPID